MTRPENWHRIQASTGGDDRVPGLLDGWVGPIMLHDGNAPSVNGGWFDGVTCPGGAMFLDTPDGSWAADFVLRAFDARRREVQHRIVDVLGLGVPCDDCDHDNSDYCPICNDTTYRVPPYDLTWAISRPGNAITAEQSAEILACSVARVRAGLGPVLNLYTHEPAHTHGDNEATVRTGLALLNDDGTITAPWPPTAGDDGEVTP